MNHVVLIGNGFDLAHGLKTSYKDFLNWYLGKVAANVEKQHNYKDACIHISFDRERYNPDFGHSLPITLPRYEAGRLTKKPELLFKNLAELKYKFEFQSILIKELFEDIQESNWVDIESLYYSIIVRIYKRSSEENISSKTKAAVELKKLNESFNEIKKELEEYLTIIEKTSPIEKKEEISYHFGVIKSSLRVHSYDTIRIVNFNYTDTISQYFTDDEFVRFVFIKHIHGKLGDTSNPIIFGYGDETDKYYEEIENVNDNEYLKFMKSFGYSRTDCYQNIMSIINSDDRYHVHIMGHSCGLSDRVLLKKIFEHEKCIRINIYYHEKNENEDDYITKYMDISRHFSLNKKEIMRERIKPKDQSIPLVRLTKKK